MRVAHTLCQGDGVTGNNGHAVINRCVVIAILAQGIAYLLVLGVIAIKISKEVSHHLVGILWLWGHLFLLSEGSTGANGYQHSS